MIITLNELRDYTTTRDSRELQLFCSLRPIGLDYTTTRPKRELQRFDPVSLHEENYTTTRPKR